MTKKLDSKKVVQRIVSNAAISVLVSTLIGYFILSFAELSFNVIHWNIITRGLFGISVFLFCVWSASHASGMINTHRRQMETFEKQMDDLKSQTKGRSSMLE